MPENRATPGSGHIPTRCRGQIGTCDRRGWLRRSDHQQTYPLAEVPDAMGHLESRHARGKIATRIWPTSTRRRSSVGGPHRTKEIPNVNICRQIRSSLRIVPAFAQLRRQIDDLHGVKSYSFCDNSDDLPGHQCGWNVHGHLAVSIEADPAPDHDPRRHRLPGVVGGMHPGHVQPGRRDTGRVMQNPP